MGSSPNGHKPKKDRDQTGLAPKMQGHKSIGHTSAESPTGANGPVPKCARAHMRLGPKCHIGARANKKGLEVNVGGMLRHVQGWAEAVGTEVSNYHV